MMLSLVFLVCIPSHAWISGLALKRRLNKIHAATEELQVYRPEYDPSEYTIGHAPPESSLNEILLDTRHVLYWPEREDSNITLYTLTDFQAQLEGLTCVYSDPLRITGLESAVSKEYEQRAFDVMYDTEVFTDRDFEITEHDPELDTAERGFDDALFHALHESIEAHDETVLSFSRSRSLCQSPYNKCSCFEVFMDSRWLDVRVWYCNSRESSSLAL